MFRNEMCTRSCRLPENSDLPVQIRKRPLRGNTTESGRRSLKDNGWATCSLLRARREQLKRVSRLWPENWLKPRPEPGLDCLICAEFARQRLGVVSPEKLRCGIPHGAAFLFRSFLLPRGCHCLFITLHNLAKRVLRTERETCGQKSECTAEGVSSGETRHAFSGGAIPHQPLF